MSRGSTSFITCAALLLTFVLFACQSADPEPPRGSSSAATHRDGAVDPAPPAPGQATVKAPFDVGKVIRQVHFSFRPCKGSGCLFEAGHGTHGVKVDSDLRVAVSPAHHEAPSSTARSHDVGPTRHSDPKDRVTPPPRVGRAATFETVSVLRGERQLSSRGKALPRDDGSMAMSRGPVTERLVNSDRGVEQSWALAKRPAGAGDLVVRVKVTGMTYRGVTAGGLHFVDASSGLGLRYGHATWVDRAGKRTAIRGVFASGHVVLRVPATVVDAAAYPAVLDPIISAEIAMDKAASGPSWGNQTRPRLAHDGTNYLVVWQDYRNNVTNLGDIYGARVSATGTVLDKHGIQISGAVNHQQNPTVAFGSGTFLVTWRDYRLNTSYPDIYGARVKPDGTVQDKAGIPIAVASSHQYEPYVVYGGGIFFVVWYDYRLSGYSDIFGARVKPDGTVQDPNGITISKASYYQYYPTAAYDGTNFFVVWSDYRHNRSWSDIYGARVSIAGKVLDTAGIAINRQVYHQTVPHVAYIYNGSTYLVTWQDNRSYSNYNIYGARVNTSGKVQDSTGFLICSATNHQYNPAVAHDGTSFYVVWQDYRNYSKTGYDIYGTAVSTAGKPASTSGTLISAATGHQQSPFLAHSGKDFMVVWSDQRHGTTMGEAVYGARIKAGTVTDPSGILVSSAANNQWVPAVGFDGTNYLVVWQDYRDYAKTGQNLWGVLVSGKGSVSTPSGIAISTYAKDQTAPAVVFGGGRYLIAWQDTRSGTHIYGAQVDTSGKVLQPTGFPLSTAAGSQVAPDVAYDGNNYIVVWQDYRNSGSYPDIYGTLVNKYGGKTSGTDIVISKATYHQSNPAVAYGGGAYYVVWDDNRNSGTTGYDIFGTQIKISGSVATVNGTPISTAYYSQQHPDVAWDGTGYMVVWHDNRYTYATGYDIFASRVSAAGVVQDKAGISVSQAGGDQLYPKIASAGSGSVALWQDYRNGKYNIDVFGTVITSAGVVKSPVGLGVAASLEHERNPELAAGAGGTYLAVYSRFTPGSSAGATRIYGRLITEEKAQGSACTAGNQCASGYCSDGFCCDKACGLGNPNDCQACSVSAGSSKDGTCETATSGTQCRAAAGVCDKAEKCDGSSVTCPTNDYQAATQVCRGALGPCDEAETCSGTSADCPTNQFKASGAVCRAAAGTCDLAEICSGASADCPVDTFMPATKECRAKNGGCDVAESCTGTSGVCPGDTFRASTEVCRTATGDCDLEEKCSGASGACPSDLFKVDGVTCKTGKCKAGQCQTIPDQGVVDKGAPDMGVDQMVPDQKVTPDQTITPDKQVPDKGPTPDQCLTQQCPDCEEGCNVAGGAGGGWLAGLLLLLVLVRRKVR